MMIQKNSHENPPPLPAPGKERKRMKCKMCISRGKTWSGSDPICAWEDGHPLSDNWNCATLVKLRNVAIERGFVKNLEDVSLATIPVDDDDYGYGWVVLSWYKSRGRTGTALFVSDEKYHELTEHDAIECLKFYGQWHQ
jgi:hypothetical protein